MADAGDAGAPSRPSPLAFTLAHAPYSTANFVKRPGVGTLGTPVRVIANHFRFRTLGDATIFHYDVALEPTASKPVLRRAWKAFTEQNMAALGLDAAAFDGAKNLFSPKKLRQDMFSGVAELPGEPRGKTFKVTVRLVARIELAELHRFLAGKSGISNAVLTAIQAIDIAFQQKLNTTLIPAGRSFFNPNARPMPLSGGLDLYSGLFVSSRPGVGCMTLNVDMAHSAFYRANSPVVQFAGEILMRPPGAQGMAQPLRHDDVKRLEKALRLVSVVATHRAPLRPRYTVRKLSRESASELKFTLNAAADPASATAGAAAAATAAAAVTGPRGRGGSRGGARGGARGGGGGGGSGAAAAVGGRTVTVAQYFQEAYNRRLQYPHLPCLMVGTPGRESALPMEVAVIEPGQKWRGKLSESQTSEVIKVAAKRPPDRLAAIMQLVRHVPLSGDPHVAGMGIDVEPQPMQIDARILPPPYLEVGERKSRAPNDGSWNFAGLKLKAGAKVTAMGVLSFVDPRRASESVVRERIDSLMDEARRMGILIHPRTKENYPFATSRYGTENVEVALRAMHDRVKQVFGTVEPELIFVLFQMRDSQMYPEVKRVGDTVLGVPTQCLVFSKIASFRSANNQAQFWANVTLKLNAKLPVPANSAMPVSFELKQPTELTKETTMLIGADVTHPAPGTNQATIAAIVGTVDPLARRYTAVIKGQPHRQEVIADMRQMFAGLLRKFHAQNRGQFPKRIIFYRDGVSEGQFEEVLKTEVADILRVLGNAKATQTKLTYVIVQKRHHTRFFAANPKDNDRSGNLKAGLVVDRAVTHPTDFDFFLQSQAGLQGTSRPTRYVVLHDDNCMGADVLQKLTFDLCFTYARCTRSVSVAPPAYYAHLVCFRARHHAHRDDAEASLATRESGGLSGSLSSAATVAPVDAKLAQSMWFM